MKWRGGSENGRRDREIVRDGARKGASEGKTWEKKETILNTVVE